MPKKTRVPKSKKKRVHVQPTTRARKVPKVLLAKALKQTLVALRPGRRVKFIPDVPEAILSFLYKMGWEAIPRNEEFNCQACGMLDWKKINDPTFLCPDCRIKACTPHRLLNKPLSEERKRQLLEEPEIISMFGADLLTEEDRHAMEKEAAVEDEIKQPPRWSFRNLWRRFLDMFSSQCVQSKEER